MSVFCDQGDGYNLDFDSDEAVSCSSESENDIDIILNGTPEQKRKLKRRSEGRKSSGDESDFEKEMDMELDKTVQALELKMGSKVKSKDHKPKGSGPSASTSKSEAPKSYEDDFFDSDDDEDEDDTKGEKRSKDKHPVLSNDDLLYDPDQDDDNQRWLDRIRQKHQPQAKNTNKAKPAPQSDAVLNCPACMITLCVDCQRHELYKNQYRAMFVMNCSVNNTEKLTFPKEKSKKKTRKRKHDAGPADGATGIAQPGGLDEEEVYNPVKCTECSTEIAVMDSEEVYHFFNVLASYA